MLNAGLEILTTTLNLHRKHMRVLCFVTERTRTPIVFNTYHHKVVEIAYVRFDETNGSQREHLPPVLDEISPEESIKFKAIEDVIPTKESAEEAIPDREENHAGATEENGPEEIAGPNQNCQPAHPCVANEEQD